MDEPLDLDGLFTLEARDSGPPPGISPSYHDSSLRFLESIHRRKSEALKEIVAAFGWPTASAMGEHAGEAAFMIVVHADYDPEFQKQCHGLMMESVRRGEMQPGFLAFLTDRILCNAGQRQRFGTQIREVSNGCFVPRPIEDGDRVDTLRASAGLSETLSDYLSRVNTGDLLLYRPLLGEYADELEYNKTHKVIEFPGKPA
jgi:hypothetical protein